MGKYITIFVVVFFGIVELFYRFTGGSWLIWPALVLVVAFALYIICYSEFGKVLISAFFPQEEVSTEESFSKPSRKNNITPFVVRQELARLKNRQERK